jgi:hypothetical protein
VAAPVETGQPEVSRDQLCLGLTHDYPFLSALDAGLLLTPAEKVVQKNGPSAKSKKLVSLSGSSPDGHYGYHKKTKGALRLNGKPGAGIIALYNSQKIWSS